MGRTDYGVGFGGNVTFGETRPEGKDCGKDRVLRGAEVAVLVCVLSEGFAEVLQVAYAIVIISNQYILFDSRDRRGNARGKPSY